MTRGAVGAAVLMVACAGLAAQGTRAVGRTPPAKANYMLNCMGCHVADGSGAPGKVPSLRDSLVALSTSAAGRRYLVQVPGASQSVLSNLELAQVLNWMVRNLSAQPVPRQFVDFTAREVARHRGTPLVNVGATRARLLAARSDPTAQR